jgi:hypothetical protein
MFQVKHGYRWLILGLVLALLLVSGIDATYAKLVGGVQARRPNDQAVELKVTVDADGLIKVVIGTNQITFQVKANQELDTGLLRISGDLVQVIENGQLVCKIPVNDIPTAYKRFCYDERKPVVRVSQSPSPNSYGWNNGNVAITVTAEDEEGGSGIKSIFYKIGTRSPVEVGAAQLSISQGGRVATYSLTISDEGTQNLGFWAVDQAGNESEHQTLTVRIDQTRPTISGSRSPGPNSYGWNNADVTVSFNCSDSLSGIASCTGQQRVSREGSGQSVTGEAVDKAGNSATATVSNINIDKTQPSISLSPSGGTYKDSVTFSWSASDGLSGLASCSVYVNGSRVSSNSSGSYTLSPGTHSVEVRAEDKAGNSRSVSVGYTVERKKPAYFDITDLSAPSRANVGDSVSISATVRNTGEERGTQDIKLYIDGSWKDSKSLSLSPGESGTVWFYYTFSYSGYYTIKVASDNDYATKGIEIIQPSQPPWIEWVEAPSSVTGYLSYPYLVFQIPVRIHFVDPNGDVNLLIAEGWHTNGAYLGEAKEDLDVWGQTHGVIEKKFTIRTNTLGVWCTGAFFLEITLRDRAGNYSNTYQIEVPVAGCVG